MNNIERIAQNPRVKTSLSSFVNREQELEDIIISIQQIPSPTFAESERATFIRRRFTELGLQDVEQDSMNNVVGRMLGKDPSRKPVILSAHSDTVFPKDTDLSVRRENNLLFGPGIGDNSTGVAGLIMLARTLFDFQIQPNSDLWFVSNICEEGLGDLRGMREIVRRFGKEVTYIVVEGGSYGLVMHEAIGVKRFRVDIATEGGHSWGSFGSPSAVHELGYLISALDRMKVPSKPKTTFNVGMVSGGISINTIAAASSIYLDLRSEHAAALNRLVNQFNDIIADQKSRAKRARKKVSYTVTEVGNRPAGRIPRNSPIVQWANEALEYVGCSPISHIAGSTDANIPLSLSIPAVCIGLTRSGNSHRVDEFIEPKFLPLGMQQLLLVTLAAAQF